QFFIRENPCSSVAKKKVLFRGSKKLYLAVAKRLLPPSAPIRPQPLPDAAAGRYLSSDISPCLYPPPA
ncbi:MAG: hypothetical protein ACKO3T_23555, partial [Planctomycetaceae bacterium]